MRVWVYILYRMMQNLKLILLRNTTAEIFPIDLPAKTNIFINVHEQCRAITLLYFVHCPFNWLSYRLDDAVTKWWNCLVIIKTRRPEERFAKTFVSSYYQILQAGLYKLKSNAQLRRASREKRPTQLIFIARLCYLSLQRQFNQLLTRWQYIYGMSPAISAR